MLKYAVILATLLCPSRAVADGIVVKDAYVRASGAMAKAGAAFMVLENPTDKEVTLIAVETTAARKVQLHTHIIENNVAKMREIEGGIVVPANAAHALERGADHVMLMGLTAPLEEGDTVELTLTFNGADAITLTIPVETDR